MGMETTHSIRLNATYPCCNGRARFVATNHIPREHYERRCPRCGTNWDVRRMTASDNGDVRIDIIEWT